MHTPLRRLARRVLPSALRKTLRLLSDSSWQWVYDHVPDRFVQASNFKRKSGRDLKLAVPQTFNEKIQWLMLYHRIPEVTQLADKYEAGLYGGAARGLATQRPISMACGMISRPSRSTSYRIHSSSR